MGKRLVDDASLTAIADRIRFETGIQETLMFPDGFLRGIEDVIYAAEVPAYNTGYDSGKEDGLTEGAERCASKHFVHSFVGGGASEVSLYIPFEPDAIHIIGFDPTFNKTPYALGAFSADLRAFGTMGGTSQHAAASGAAQSTFFTTKTILSRYSRTPDGVITIGNISSSIPVVFSPGYLYTVIAVRYTEQTDQERITAFVEGLTGSGTVALNQAKVSAAFTDNEWVMLIATKPNWTFTWF